MIDLRRKEKEREVIATEKCKGQDINHILRTSTWFLGEGVIFNFGELATLKYSSLLLAICRGCFVLVFVF